MNAESSTTAQSGDVISHALEFAEGHLIVETADERYLIDTGSPVSLGYKEIHFAQDHYQPASSLAGLTMNEVRQHLDVPVDALIGMDILSRYHLLFDVPGEQLLCTRADGTSVHANFSIPPDTSLCSLQDVGGVPFVRGQLDGAKPALFAFDTGAQLSYLRAAPASGPGSIREAEDSFPRLGCFQTPVYRRRWWVLNGDAGDTTAVELEFGVLPPLLGLALDIVGAGGIIGAEFLRHCRAVFSLSSQHRLLGVYPPRPSGLTP